MPACGQTLCLSRLLDRREPQDGLQGAVSGAGALDAGWLGSVRIGRPVTDIAAAMAIGVLDSAIFADMFGTPAMRGVFGGRALIARCVEVEAALARVQGRLRIIPAEAADAITQSASAFASGKETLDLARLKRVSGIVG